MAYPLTKFPLECVTMPRDPVNPKDFAYASDGGFPLSPGAAAGDWLFLSGCVPVDGSGGVVGGTDVAAQTEQVLANLVTVLAARGGSLDDVIKCNVYLADIRTFQAMNDVFASHFPNDPPARTTVEARLADSRWLVEIEAVAYLGKG